MTQHDFCMWLNGYVELGGEHPTPDQWEMIKDHLALVFNKTTRSLEEIRQDFIIESEKRKQRNLEWVKSLLQEPKAPDNEPVIVEKPETPVVDGPKEVKPKQVQRPWQIPDLPDQAIPWTGKPFDLPLFDPNKPPTIIC